MDAPQSRDLRPLLIGGAIALVAGIGIALVIGMRAPASHKPPPASQSGLIVELGRDDDAKLDPARPLRCFVGGKFVGEVTLADCAERNGVATGALDVGLDESGALVAAEQAGELLTPLPPPTVAAPAPTPVVAAPGPATAPAAPTDVCWRYGGGWRQVGAQPLNACIQTLFAGHCVKAGDAEYGRWGQQTLRLVSGRVEISSDNRTFRGLADQTAGCSLPAVG